MELWIHMLEMGAQMSVKLNLDSDVLQMNQGSALKYAVRVHSTIITTNVTMATTRMEMDVINHANLKRVSRVKVEVQILMISAMRYVVMGLIWGSSCAMTVTISQEMAVVPLVKLRKVIFVKVEIQQVLTFAEKFVEME